jgi:Type II CAAX prenyl endopeptidase Rce1-like
LALSFFMWGSRLKITVAVRAVVLVFGIAAIATLLNRVVSDSGLRMWLLMNQQSLPGSLWAMSAIEHLTYGLAVLALSFCVARSYWPQLFPEHLNIWWLVASFILGVFFALFLNHPMHDFLFGIFFGNPAFTGGAIADSIAAGIFSGLAGYERLFTLSAFATILVTPFIEELTDRGIVFREAESLGLLQVALLSFLMFCFSHYAIGGFAKVLAVVPAALLFVAIRLKTGSFIYAFAAHVAVNMAALLKLQVF